MPLGTSSRWDLQGTPGNMSVSESDELIVLVGYRGVLSYRYQLFIYRTSDVTRMRIVNMPIEMDAIHHAVQSHHETFIISHYHPSIISEVSLDGRKVFRSIQIRWFNPLSYHESLRCKPDYLAIAGDGRIFVADRTRRLLVLVNSQLTEYKIVKNEGRSAMGKSLLHISYVQRKQRVIFSDRRRDGRFRVSIAHLGPCDVNRRSTVNCCLTSADARQSTVVCRQSTLDSLNVLLN